MGHVAIFIRLAGCNLHCAWCDTDHSAIREMTVDEINAEIDQLSTGGEIIVFTGGEPTLQLNEDDPIAANRFRCIETNGTVPVPSWIDWITISPKSDIDMRNRRFNEIKIIYEPERENYLKAVSELPGLKYIQPLERGGCIDYRGAVDYVLRNPEYRLSLQTQKVIDIQ